MTDKPMTPMEKSQALVRDVFDQLRLVPSFATGFAAGVAVKLSPLGQATIEHALAWQTAMLQVSAVAGCPPSFVEQIAEGLGVDQLHAVCARVCRGETLTDAIEAVR